MQRWAALAFLTGSSLVFWKRKNKPAALPDFDESFLLTNEHLEACFYRKHCVTDLRGQLSSYANPALDFQSLLKLAKNGNELCLYMPTTSLETGRSVFNLEKEMRKLKIDAAWQTVLKFTVAPICEEDDLSCEDQLLISPEVRIDRLLTFLVYKLEKGSGDTLVRQGFLSLLLDIYTRFAISNRRVSINALKALSNLAMQSEYCAASIVKTEWLHLLSSLVSDGSLEESLLSQKICVNALSTFQKASPRLKSGVYELFCSEEEPVLDIIFLHGLRGSVFRTWRERDDFSKLHRSRCWPRDWLPKDLPVPARILAVDYASSLTKFTGNLETLTARSKRFLQDLQEAGVGSRPVAFICHSIGGLLAKNLLLDDADLLKHTVGILFFATPHLGSPIAKYSTFAIRPAQDVKMLRYKNVLNKKLHDDFLLVCDSVPVIISVLETEKAPLFFGRKGLLVPWESAFFERGSVYHVRDFHYNVCKPRSQSDNIYKVVLQFIGDVIHCIKNS